MRILSIYLLLFTMLIACEAAIKKEPANSSPKPEKRTWTADLKQLSLEEYPDNPDWEIRHSAYDQIQYPTLSIKKEGPGQFSFTALPGNEKTDTLHIPTINIMEYIPNAPSWILGDEYLVLIGLVNQEFNRHQVRFDEGLYQLTGGKEQFHINRVDLARNCLNAYLWELIIYAEDADGETKPYYHAWFNFPKDLYADLFNQRNPTLQYEDYRKSLEDWVDIESKAFDLNKLRSIVTEKETKFKSLNDKFYPLVSERKKKQKNIITPKEVSSIDGFLNDSTLFATFSPPGLYETKNPKMTELSRFSKLEKVIARKTTANNSAKTACIELEYVFRRNTNDSIMRMIVGGIMPDNLQARPVAEAHKGWQMPMGISDHSFYETYEKQQSEPAAENPYFAILLDGQGNWLDSHIIGIDGPLFHLDEQNPNLLHLWILSFERHAFVGHFTCDLSVIKTKNLIQ